MYRTAKVAPFFVFAAALCFQSLTTAQEEAPLHVGALGAIPSSVKPIQPSPEVASFLPQGAVVCVLANTTLSAAGETTLVYATDYPDDPGGPEKEPHIAVVRAGKIAEDFSPNGGGYLASFAEFRLDGKTRAAVIALRSYGDGAGTDFYFLRFDGQSYVLERVANTYAGRIEIVETDPAEFRVWSAGVDSTCVWCEQRYNTHIYVWKNGKFKSKSRAVTSKKYFPADINQHPIVKGPSGPRSTA